MPGTSSNRTTCRKLARARSSTVGSQSAEIATASIRKMRTPGERVGAHAQLERRAKGPTCFPMRPYSAQEWPASALPAAGAERLQPRPEVAHVVRSEHAQARELPRRAAAPSAFLGRSRTQIRLRSGCGRGRCRRLVGELLHELL